MKKGWGNYSCLSEKGPVNERHKSPCWHVPDSGVTQPTNRALKPRAAVRDGRDTSPWSQRLEWRGGRSERNSWAPLQSRQADGSACTAEYSEMKKTADIATHPKGLKSVTEVSGSTPDEQGLAQSGHSLPTKPPSPRAITWLSCRHLLTKKGLEALRNPNKRPANHQRPGLVIHDPISLCFK